MAYAVSIKLQQLEALSTRDRRAQVQELLKHDKPMFYGITLYKHHVIPTIRTGWESGLSPDYAEIRAGLRWEGLDEIQKAYWRRLTLELAGGSLEPLAPSVLANFNEGHLAECSSCITIARVEMIGQRPLEQLEDLVADEAPIDITQHVALLRTTPRGPAKEDLFRSLRQRFSSDGQTLFSHHASTVIWKDLDLMSDIPQLSITEAWATMYANDQSYWQHQTYLLQNALGKYISNVLTYLDTDGDSERSSSCTAKMQSALRRYQASLPEPLTHPAVAELVTPTSTPVLELLYGSRIDRSKLNEKPQAVILKVLRSLSSLIKAHPNMTLRGRHTGMRIDFNPHATDVTGIAVRMQTATKRGLTVKRAAGGSDDLASHFEWLLQALVFFNRNTLAFLSLSWYKFSKQEASKYSLQYRSFLDCVRPNLKRVSPIEHAKRDVVVAAVMEGVRARASKTMPGHEVFYSIDEVLRGTVVRLDSRDDVRLEKRVRYWSLARDDDGFGAQLFSCFVRDDLKHEEYEDLLEQKLFALDRHTRGIMFSRDYVRN